MPLLMCQTMPTSEEFQGKVPSETLSRPKAMEGRKSSKPLMEKRRRARINDSLTQLKTLILEATNKDTSRHSKLEKADILEMTVRYLKNLQRHHIVASMDSEVNTTKYRMGYSECIGEVSRFLSPMDTNLVDLRLQLLSHLAQTCPLQKQSSPSAQSIPNSQSASSPTQAPAAITTHIPQSVQLQVASSTGNTNIQTVPITVTAQPQHAAARAVPSATPVQFRNEATPMQVPQQSPTSIARIVSGIQVGLPAGITGGEIALVIPPHAFANGQVPSHFIPVYSQHASVLSPSSAATIPSASQSMQSPIGTATASISQLPSNITYQSVSPIASSTPFRNTMPTSNEVIMKVESNVPQSVVSMNNSLPIPVQTYVTLRSPLQTSHHQNQATLPIGVKDKYSHEAMDMDDQSCWRPW